MQDVARLLFVRVHIGRGQDPCISEQVRCTRRTPTDSGVDGVKMVGRARGVKTVGGALVATERAVCLGSPPSQARRTRRTPTASGVDGVKTAWRKRMTQTVSGIDGVKTVGRARGVKTVGC